MSDTSADTNVPLDPTGESPQTQINNVSSMMWPNLADIDVAMQDDNWIRFYGTATLSAEFDPAFNGSQNQWPI